MNVGSKEDIDVLNGWMNEDKDFRKKIIMENISEFDFEKV